MASTRGEWPSVVGYSRISRGRILGEREEEKGRREEERERGRDMYMNHQA